MKRYEIVRPCDRHSNETVTLRKHVTKYKHMYKQTNNKQTIMIYKKKMAVQRIAYTRINSLSFKVSSVHIDCYYYYYHY